MTFQQIDYILAVAEEQSFSKAAERLYMTQPSLSQSILKTEKKLGFKIFDRSTTPLTLTKQGEIYIDYAKRVKQLESSFMYDISALSGDTALKVVCESFVMFNAVKAVNECKRNILISQTDDDNFSDGIFSGMADIMIITRELKGKGIFCQKLCDIPLVLTAPSSANSALPFIHAGRLVPQECYNGCLPQVSVNDEFTAALLVKSGAGKAFLTKTTADLMKLDYIVPINEVIIPLYIVYRDNKPDSDTMAFIDSLKRIVENDGN